MNQAQRGRNVPPQLPSLNPDLRLFGKVSDTMLSEFFRQQSEVQRDKAIVLELSSEGGDADIGRRIAQEVKLWRAQGREVFFLGKTYVYSAGITIMSAFPRSHRFMTADCELLIHERKIKKDIHLDGALRGCRSTINDVLAQIDSGQRLERAGFEELVKGSALTADDVASKVLERDWYLTANEAKDAGLIAEVI